MAYIEGDYTISDDKSLISLDRVCELLATSYWAATRSRSCIETSIANSIPYGIYHNGHQVGFARVITDFATTWYLADVIVDDVHKGKGLGKKLVQFITAQSDYQNLLGILLTKDAHGLYEQYGFNRDAEVCMLKRKTT